ncbi:DUF4372 domain-containing protein [Candidatus Tisiphia endosymbiont of Hybos culiciformis]|uniref:DUF4372 domain-containing protein n=1 Tax=Candidatus Tisiphia endosymbiont of Hybos culiciformis TaxID=3139331 RepID=UPI003CCAFA88
MYQHSTFGVIVKLLDREIISKLVKSHQSDKYSKKFSTWNHLVTMLFGHFTDCRSLRDLGSYILKKCYK